MRRLTLEPVQTECGGVLPPDAVLISTGGAANVSPLKREARRPSRAARFGALNAFTDFALAGLTGAEAKVWLILFRDTKADMGTARTGQADITRRAGLSVRGVRKALAVRRRGRLNCGPSVYRVTAPGRV